MRIGEASCRIWDENWLEVWTLRIGKEEILGRWIIVDRGSGYRSENDHRPLGVAGRGCFQGHHLRTAQVKVWGPVATRRSRQGDESPRPTGVLWSEATSTLIR